MNAFLNKYMSIINSTTKWEGKSKSSFNEVHESKTRNIILNDEVI